MPRPLATTLDDDKDYITLKFSGDLTEDRETDFKKDLEEAGEVIADHFRTTQKKLHILLDMTDFTGNYSGTNLSALAQFAAFNKFFVEKTASFGGSEKVKLAGEVAIAMSHRDNIKIFKTKEEAIAWLDS